ncbi:MAG: transcription antitermination factor NusB, partial [Pseudomonadota bacterium]
MLDRGRMLDDGVLGGGPEDKAQALGLAGLVLRRLGQIDQVLAGFVERMPTPPVNHALRLVTAELVFAETPGHAAIDMAVRATKEAGAPRMAGLVNAVGRRISEAAPGTEGSDASLNMPPAFRAALA